MTSGQIVGKMDTQKQLNGPLYAAEWRAAPGIVGIESEVERNLVHGICNPDVGAARCTADSAKAGAATWWAVDGRWRGPVASTPHNDPGCFQTADAALSWYQVDFGEEVSVGRVEILGSNPDPPYVPDTREQSRLLTISVGNELSGGSLNVAGGNANDLCADGVDAHVHAIANCRGPVRGRYMKIWKDWTAAGATAAPPATTRSLTLCELSVHKDRTDSAAVVRRRR
jgi:hypothetical protein